MRLLQFFRLYSLSHHDMYVVRIRPRGHGRRLAGMEEDHVRFPGGDLLDTRGVRSEVRYGPILHKRQ